MTTRSGIPFRLILDVDSTVLVVYGNQERAEVGYNPTKRGRPSYHPLLCFEGFTKNFWHGELRPGDFHTATGAKELLSACFGKVPKGVRSVLIRADKGFYDHEFVEWIESHQALQLTLFKQGRYHYQVLVTNLSLTPLNLWRLYNDRAGIELLIRQLKGDYPLGKIPTRYFFANEAYFHLLLFAYNLINWFKQLCLPPEFQKPLSKLFDIRSSQCQLNSSRHITDLA